MTKSARAQRMRQRRLAEGLCTRCGERNPRGTWECDACKSKATAWAKARRNRNRANGLCAACGSIPEKSRSFCDSCLVARRADAKRRREEAKSKGLCQSCKKRPLDGKSLCEPCLVARRPRAAVQMAASRKARPFRWFVTAKRYQCKSGGIPLDLTEDYLERLWNAQAGKCFWIEMEIAHDLPKNHPRKATLDRLDPALGYVVGNVVWASSFANRGRVDYSADEFKLFLEQLLGRNLDLESRRPLSS